MKFSWVPLAILGAFVYGSYSFLLGYVAPEIKQHQGAQMGYGLTLGIARIPISIILYAVWYFTSKQDRTYLHQYINWKTILLTLIFGILIDPVHTLVVNAGGSVGHQAMFSLSIIPVILGGLFFFHKHLGIRKWIGIVLSCASMWLMTT